MTLYNSAPSSAGLGYGGGGQASQATTAPSSNNYAYVPMQLYHNLSPEQRAVMDRAVRDGRAHFDPGRDAYIFTQGLEPESSAGWVQIQTAQMQAQQAMLQAQQAMIQRGLNVASTAPQEMTIAQAASNAYQQAVGLLSTGIQAAGLQNITVGSTAGYWHGGQWVQATTTQKSTDATIRSMELLYDWLNPDQRKQLATRGFFSVIGGKSGTHYRIYEPANYNIHELDKNTGETLVKICFQPVDRTLPKGDIWLCQKLALELDEENTLALANRSGNYHY